MPQTILIVADPALEGDSALDLSAVLRADGVDVFRTTTRALLADEHDGLNPDVLLVHARVTTSDVRDIKVHAVRGGGTPPPMIVFSGHDYSLLDPHLRAGYDYLLPPFMPWLVRRRIDACRQNERVSTVEEIEAVSHLLKNERELQIAREIQRGFLPTELPCPQGWQIEARFRPAREVAGDFYDGFELVNGRRMGFVVGDVCDKGVGAALFMALIRTLLRHGAQQSNPGEMLVSDLSAIATATVEDQPDTASQIPALPTIGALPLTSAVRGTNEYMTRNHLEQGYFVTLLFFVLDPASGSVLYINGGHNPPVVLRTDGSRELLAPTGPAVGLFPGAVFDLAHTTLEVGDTLFAYTDGVTEARDSVGDFFTDARMHKVLADPVESAQELLDRIDGAVVGFVGAAEQSDDLTMLAMRRVPPGEAGVDSGRQD